MKKIQFPLLFILFAVIAMGLVLFQARSAAANKSDNLKYDVKASNGRLIRKVTGSVTSEVNGIPASPVDSFIWNGEGIQAIKGAVRVKIDPVANTGKITATWRDPDGNHWQYEQVSFAPPDHPSGLVVGPGANDTQLILDDPVVTNVYLHGDTTAGGPILPTLFNLLATWGPAKITLNGQPFDNPFDGPAPLWIGHTMTTVGVRNENGEVLNQDGSIFNMMAPANGVTYDDQIEFHLVFHDAPGPMVSGNVPPPLSFFYHVTFTDVDVEIEGSR